MFIFVNTDWETGDYTDYSNDLEYFDTNNLTAGSAGVCPQSYALDLCLVFFRSSLACMTALCVPVCPSIAILQLRLTPTLLSRLGTVDQWRSHQQ